MELLHYIKHGLVPTLELVTDLEMSNRISENAALLIKTSLLEYESKDIFTDEIFDKLLRNYKVN